MIDCESEPSSAFRQVLHVRDHVLHADVSVADGSTDSAPSPHDYFDAALAACKALTATWFARRNGIPLERVESHVERDDSLERQGTYQLTVRLGFHGPLTDEQRKRLYDVASRCPIHKLMTTTDVVIEDCTARYSGMMATSDEIELLIPSRPREIEPGVAVGRVLPAAVRRHVGPWVFCDELGPIRLEPGHGLDVRPHPHIGLATVTYLFEGEILHRDSLGSSQVIRPGAVNWMTAGRGIVHSERTTQDRRAQGGLSHGLQLWVGLPTSAEDGEASFRHYSPESIPQMEDGGARLRVLAGSAFGATSPVETASSMFAVDLLLSAGAELEVPTGHEERALYVVEGEVLLRGARVPHGTLAVFSPGSKPVVRADGPARAMLLGGAPLDGPRHIWWNFVSTSPDRIIAAAHDWKAGRFPKVPGDELELVPLTQEPSFTSRHI